MALLPSGTRWSFGGGTCLALRYGHRVSYDVDLFITDAQLIPYMVPRLNDDVAALVGYDVVENSASLKVILPHGDIDVIVGAVLTQPGVTEVEFANAAIPAQTAEEVLAKKMEYRGHAFTHRDAFDLAMLLERDPARVATAEEACSDVRLVLLRQRLDLLLPRLTEELPIFVNPTEAGAPLMTRAASIIRTWLDT
ncbi:MAG TPA: nucleotidyl transferase AbiEii/AbiGii toxin family protein [Acetobacteraceae bacterium]|nr:nucleotidyl transferase AbiEii/AbiGii toxin family protein [Acetobacteraceae bacterium]